MMLMLLVEMPVMGSWDPNLLFVNGYPALFSIVSCEIAVW